MWTKLLQICCLWSYTYFAMGNAKSDFSLNSSYPIIYESIFHAVKNMTLEDYLCECNINLNGNSLEFFCSKYYPMSDKRQVPELKGSFNLDKEAETMFHCLAELQSIETQNRTRQCDMSEADYQRRIFKNCNKENVHAITIMTSFPNKFLYYNDLNFLASNLPNLTEINVYQRHDDIECQSLNLYLRIFKNVNKIIMHFESGKDLDRCTEYKFTNLTIVKEVVIGISESDIFYMGYLSLYNNNILRKMENLEVLELRSQHKRLEFKITQEQFHGLTKLSSLRFIDCYINNLTPDHFQDLVNLKYLTIIGGLTNNFDWLR